VSRVVFDIETLGYPLEDFDESRQEYLLKFAHTEEERVEAVQKLSLSPLTAQILAIGMINPDSSQGKVFYQDPVFVSSPSAAARQADPDEPQEVEYIPLDEAGILREFWKAIVRYDQFITFNGRTFDCPFILLRSAVLGIKPQRNLMPYRWSAAEHCDLLEQLTYYGAVRKFNLDFYCKSFGIKSPKESGVTGLDMGRLFEEGRYRQIAEYCFGDIKATAELFRRWQTLLSFEK
jgi:3'-5' exonuclease